MYWSFYVIDSANGNGQQYCGIATSTGFCYSTSLATGLSWCGLLCLPSWSYGFCLFVSLKNNFSAAIGREQ